MTTTLYPIVDRRAPRFNRRALGARTLALGASGPASLASARVAAAAGGPPAPRGSGVELRPIPATAAPFDADGRRELAMDALTFFVRQSGLFPGRGVYQLPVAPWITGHEAASPRRAWDSAVPAGVPLYLLACAASAGRFDAAQTTVTVDGVPVPDLAAYAHAGVPALFEGRMRDYTVLDLVFAPASPGRYRVEVKSHLLPERLEPGADTNSDEEDDDADTAPYLDTVLVYDVMVQAPDALAPWLWRDDRGTVYATLAGERRRIPDPETLQALGFSYGAIANASPAFLAAVPEGPPLPELREGMLVRADDHAAVFRLESGRRRRVDNVEVVVPHDEVGGRERSGTGTRGDVRTVEAPVLQSIPPVLVADMLIKGLAPEVLHVDGGSDNTLRKVPDWRWVSDRKLKSGDVLHVPDRIIATLPQNSPHWVQPGGAWSDRSFRSGALGREMPYRVYLPPKYDAPDEAGRRYPVLYLLHGLGGRFDEWSGYGVEEVANELLADGKMVKTMIVLPQGGLGYWMNQDGGTRWGDYLVHDLVQHVDATYRTQARREARAIGGLSMGAHGALQLALNHPTVFGVAGGHSPSLRSRENAPAFFGGEAGFPHRDPIALVKEAPSPAPPYIWIDAGERDVWRSGAEALHEALAARGWSHEWRVFAGDHDGWYWGDHLWDYLPFYAAAFTKGGAQVTR